VFWLAYRYVRTRTEYVTSGVAAISNCWQVGERSVSSEVRLVRISAEGVGDPSTRWTDSFSSPVDEYSPTNLDLAARGSRLYLAIPDGATAHILVFDWANL
jgi:hypothetical protein